MSDIKWSDNTRFSVVTPVDADYFMMLHAGLNAKCFAADLATYVGNKLDTVFLKSANNLSDLADDLTARNNLGLGTAATQFASETSNVYVASVDGVAETQNLAVFTDTFGTIGNGGYFSDLLLSNITTGSGISITQPGGSNTNIILSATGSPPTGTAGGDLSGSYPNPVVSKINTVSLGTTTATSGNILIADGSAWQSKQMIGDVTIASTGVATIPPLTILGLQVANSTITYSKIQTIPATTLIGNPSGATTNASSITLGATLAFSSSVLQTVAMTGDITSPANSFVTTLATVNSNVGTFGSGTQIPIITATAKGFITAISQTPITGVNPVGPAGGDLSGTYPNPTVAKINTASLGTTTATSGNILIGDGTAWQSKQMIGDVNIASTGVATIPALTILGLQIANSTVTFSKIQTIPATTLIGNPTGGATNASTITLGSTLTFSSAVLQTTALTGDVTSSANSFATTIANNAVSNAKIRQSVAFSVIGNSTNATGNVSDISATLNGTVLRLSGATLGFGALDLSLGGSAVTNALGVGNGGTALNATTTGAMLYGASASAYASLAGNFTTTKQYLSQSGNGTTPNAPAWSSIAGTDITGAALTSANDTNVTMTLGGTPATSLLRATSLTLGWTGSLSIARGGTATTSQVTNGINYYDGTKITSIASFTFSGTAMSIGTGSPISGSILSIAKDDTNSAAQHLALSGLSAPNKQLLLGYNTTTNIGTIQAQIFGSSNSPLALNPNGGNVGINTSTPNGTLQFANATNTRTIVLSEVSNNDNQVFALGVNSGFMRFQVSDTGTDFRFFAGLTSSTSQECFRIRGNQTFVSPGSGNIWNNSVLNFYTDAGTTLRGYVGQVPGKTDVGLVSKGSGNFLRLGSNGGLIGFWTDNNIDVNDTPNVSIIQGGNIAMNLTSGGLQIARAAVSAGTANATLVTGITLTTGSSGTINNSSITTSHIGIPFIITRSGTLTQASIVCSAGSFVLTANSLDTSTYGALFIKFL